MPGSVTSTLRHRTCARLLLLTSRGGGYYYYPHLTDERDFWTCLRSRCYLSRHDLRPRLAPALSPAPHPLLSWGVPDVLSGWASIRALKEKGCRTQSGWSMACGHHSRPGPWKQAVVTVMITVPASQICPHLQAPRELALSNSHETARPEGWITVPLFRDEVK